MSAVLEKNTAVATTAPSLISRFASRYNVEPAKLLATLKATAFYSADVEITNEQMMALLIVADQYRLNPFTKEIYAFVDKKRGGIVPIVGIDGWSRIVNEQAAFDGVEFLDGPIGDKHKQAPEWIECVMHRKDREHPTKVRERLSECLRDTGPWGSHPARMLRHKAFMQCARIAFAFVGIYDEDEAQRIIEGDAGAAREESPNIASINKSISRGKATIEGEAQRVDGKQEQSATARVAVPGAAAVAERAGGVAPPTSAQVEDQMTVIDAIAKLASFSDAEKMAEWADGEVPLEIRQDDRFTKAFKARMDALKEGAATKGKK